MVKIQLIPKSEFSRVESSIPDKYTKLELLGNMCRFNALNAVKRAGSGHLGTSFSAMDLLTYLYFSKMNVRKVGVKSNDRDIYLPSKGHDVPAQYAILAALGIIEYDKLMKLRRLRGLDGHPEVSIPGIEMNSGSLGMGISKAKGFAWAKRKNGWGGMVYVLTGDGELQEGQNYEALQNAVHQKLNNIQVIVDRNTVQSDKPVVEIISLGDLAAKFRAFGWHVETCDGHDFRSIEQALERCKKVKDKPKVLIANTLKGKGISFMEHPKALIDGCGSYKWHAGAPNDENFEKGREELLKKLEKQCSEAKIPQLKFDLIEEYEKKSSGVSAEKVVQAYGKALVEAGKRRKDIVVLDADLALDCCVREFELQFPERFIENGIAEQDMVSMAGGLALSGMLPVVNSFSTFLAARANEQIYTNATERTKIIYVCHLAGIIPAGPGKSHQGVRDISLFQALPNMIILEPCNATETKMVVDYCVDEAKESCMIRLTISPSPSVIELPKGYELSIGRGAVLKEGKDVVIFSYGPVMLHEALKAAEILGGRDISLKVVNMPWLNRTDTDWLVKSVGSCKIIFTLDNHMVKGGLSDTLLDVANKAGLLKDKEFIKFGLEEYPECGNPTEVLQHHGLDGASLASRVEKVWTKKK